MLYSSDGCSEVDENEWRHWLHEFHSWSRRKHHVVSPSLQRAPVLLAGQLSSYTTHVTTRLPAAMELLLSELDHHRTHSPNVLGETPLISGIAYLTGNTTFIPGKGQIYYHAGFTPVWNEDPERSKETEKSYLWPLSSHHNMLKMSTIGRNVRWVVALNMA